MSASFDSHMRQIELGAERHILMGRMPDELHQARVSFEQLWQMHPQHHSLVKMFGKPIPIPRWQQAYGRDYEFSGQVSSALPLIPELQAFLDWARATIQPTLNGLLVNWYDGTKKHYIGPHHDDVGQLIHGSVIVTVSLGAARCFRLNRYERHDGRMALAETRDVVADNGSVIILPWATNLSWKHSVPHRSRDTGRRISITMRSFRDHSL